MRGCQRERFSEGGSLEEGVAVLAQDPGGELQHGGLVLDNEDRFSAAWGVGGGDRRCCRGRRVGGGEGESEGRADAFLGVDAHTATSLGDDAVDGGQPEAGALALRFGREEWFEDVSGDVRAHAGSGIADRELDVVTRAGVGVQTGPRRGRRSSSRWSGCRPRAWRRGR